DETRPQGARRRGAQRRDLARGGARALRHGLTPGGTGQRAMDFEPSVEQKAVRDTFARFCDQRIAPQAAALDEARAFPRELFGELAALGLFGMRYPEEVGGSGMALTEFCIALEEIARGSMSLAGAAAMQSLMGTKFLHMLGNADIVERLFKPALEGQ